MFEGQPKGLYALALANTGERFGYYTMIAVFALFLYLRYFSAPTMVCRPVWLELFTVRF